MRHVSDLERAKPFAKKHFRYWIPVTGGMILIGSVNLLVGYLAAPTKEGASPRPITVVIPKSPYDIDARWDGPDGVPVDAAGDAASTHTDAAK